MIPIDGKHYKSINQYCRENPEQGHIAKSIRIYYDSFTTTYTKLIQNHRETGSYIGTNSDLEFRPILRNQNITYKRLKHLVLKYNLQEHEILYNLLKHKNPIGHYRKIRGQYYKDIKTFCKTNTRYKYKDIEYGIYYTKLSVDQILDNLDKYQNPTGNFITIRGKCYKDLKQFCEKNPQYNYYSLINTKSRTGLSIDEIITHLDNNHTATGSFITVKGKDYPTYRAFCQANQRYNYKTVTKTMALEGLTFEQVVKNIDITGSARGSCFLIWGKRYQYLGDFFRANPQLIFERVRKTAQEQGITIVQYLEQHNSKKQFNTT